jgi:branched-subunit amino acid transport protein
MRKIVLTYGLIAGAILSLMMLVTLLVQDRIGFDNVAITFLEPLPVGVVFALVTAGVLGRRRRA